MDVSDGVALLALAVSVLVAVRQALRERRTETRTQEREREAFVQVRLIDYGNRTWWRIENHGPHTAHLWALNVLPIDAPPEAEHGEGERFNEPSPADPPLHDPRLLPRLLPPDSYVFLPADLADVPPPYRAMVWFSDGDDSYKGKAVSRPVAPEPPL